MRLLLKILFFPLFIMVKILDLMEEDISRMGFVGAVVGLSRKGGLI